MIRLLAFVLAALLPLFGSDYLLEIGSFVAIQSISVIGLGFLTGFAGRISWLKAGSTASAPTPPRCW